MGKNYKYTTYSSHGHYGTNCLFSAILNFIAMIPVGIIMGILYLIGKILEPIFGSDFVKETEKKSMPEEVSNNTIKLETNIKKEDDIKTISPVPKIVFKKNVHCPLCGSTMILRKGPYGKFYGCSMYPKCKGIHKIRSKNKN